jgi:hypothetical protein
MSTTTAVYNLWYTWITGSPVDKNAKAVLATLRLNHNPFCYANLLLWLTGSGTALTTLPNKSWIPR